MQKRRVFIYFGFFAALCMPRAHASKVLHYSFDNATVTSGSQIVDESGSGHPATVVNNDAITTTGRFGQALKVTGTSWLRVANPEGITMGNANLTVCCWVKSTAASGTIFAKDNNGTHVSGDKWFGIDTNKKFHLDHGWVGAVIGAGTINDGQWHHLAWVQTKDSAGTNGTNEGETLYVDGKVDNTGNLATLADPAGSTISFCRASSTADVKVNYAGLLDEIKIYSRALSADDVHLEYINNGVKPNAITPRAWTNFE